MKAIMTVLKNHLSNFSNGKRRKNENEKKIEIEITSCEWKGKIATKNMGINVTSFPSIPYCRTSEIAFLCL